MFSAIAGRYDLLNHLLSFNADRGWRRVLVDMSEAAEGSQILDVATGTGDVAVEFAGRSRAGVVVGLDISAGMLAQGQNKLDKKKLSRRVGLIEGDAFALPFATGEFDIVTMAFGLRNLPDYRAGIEEMTRVLKPGGGLLILEFFPPRAGLFLKIYRFYLGTLLPVVGRIVSGSDEAYEYLATSIRGFISHDDVRCYMERAGLANIHSRKLSGGIAHVYRAIKL
jgi:demethylmenaquinone methyltransferase/2-methoxy-6-polyprenyl-1,4-benzoquinol methylase